MLGELALRLGADSERRRVRGDTLRKIPFDLLELAKQLVVFGVRHGRTVQDVVLVRSAGEVNAQLRRAAMLLLAGLPRRLLMLIGAGSLVRFLLVASFTGLSPSVELFPLPCVCALNSALSKRTTRLRPVSLAT